MAILKNLQPEKVWNYFEEICNIPRPSKKEGKIISYLLEFGKKFNLETKKDDAGNVVIRKPASKGKENYKTVVLQSHVDMVCEKNSNVQHNFETDPIVLHIDGEWLKAKGTTLGADNGIGVAASLAVLASNDIEHGPIECLFTVDEETGLTGAFSLKPDFLKGTILLNLDSEDEDQIFIGCAGGKQTSVKMNYSKEPFPLGCIAFNISVTGLQGGHSGGDIHLGRGNSIKILNRLLWNASNLHKIRISNIEGGNLHNAIPREAFAIIAVPENEKNKFTEYVTKYNKIIKDEFSVTDSKVEVSCISCNNPAQVIDLKTQNNLLNSLYACPNGVIAMSADIPGLVETSTNLAIVKISDGEIKIVASQRSSVESSKQNIADMVESAFRLSNAKVEQGEGYPGWKPNTKSEILNVTKTSFKKVLKYEPKILAIHAGLECGVIGEKYPSMDMISFGPTMRDVHSPDEKLEIKSVNNFWVLLLEVLKNIPVK
ncbi:MAG: aminoacyl-histidine dipeptidase [Bacteroidales bacterium]|nr:aminoacyl-histidine dipeptidase [Bacteroidales bacterium]